MKPFTLSVAEGIRGQGSNTYYPEHTLIESLDDLSKAVQWDHVAGLFKDNHRCDKDFIQADAIVMDCDNDHTNDEAAYFTPELLADRLPGVQFYVAYSRNHMREKQGTKNEPPRSARPRWHVYFALSETVTNSKRIKELKELLLVLIPEFDAAAKDTARQFFGVERPKVEVHEGTLCVDEFLTIAGIELPEPETKSNTFTVDNAADTGAVSDSLPVEVTNSEDNIPVGERHGTLLKVAMDALSRYSESKAREVFDKACARCKPQKPLDEVARIWHWALDKRNSFKERQKKVLTLSIFEEALKGLGLSLRYNVINKEGEITGIPADRDFAPASFYELDALQQNKVIGEMLPTYLQSFFKSKNFGGSSQFITDALNAVFRTHPHNPVSDIINSVTWDNHSRIEELRNELCIDCNQFELLCKWLHQAVAMAFNDAGTRCNAFVLVLQGKQGAGKTSFFKRLAVLPELFGEGVSIDMRDKDSIMISLRTWITELGELDSTLKREQASLKAFLTRASDTLRPPYGRKAINVERRTVFCATVNPEQSLRDDTGSRRYVVIHVDNISKQFIYETMTPEWCTQLWREVYETLYLVRGADNYYLNESEIAALERSNSRFTVPLEGEIEINDCLDWNNDEHEYTEWDWCTISDLKRTLKPLERIDTRKIGRAILAVLAKRGADTPQYKRLIHGRTEYFLPPVLKKAEAEAQKRLYG